MATFHAIGCFDFTIMMDKSGMMVDFKHCLCVMFVYQPCFLHISKDVLYDFNNLASSSLYWIPTTSFQGRQWVVGCGWYCIVGDSLNHNFHVVKIVKDKHEVLNILLQCSDTPTIFFH
jgi:hypothetical protein